MNSFKKYLKNSLFIIEQQLLVERQNVLSTIMLKNVKLSN